MGEDRLVMMSETYVEKRDLQNKKRKYYQGWILKNGNVDKEIFLEKEHLRPSDCTELPNGDIIILEHRVHAEVDENGKKNTIRISKLHCNGKSITNGGILKRDIFHEFSRVSYLDNFEGIAARNDADGSTVIYILSDNNMKDSDTQENLLLKFQVIQQNIFKIFLY